MTEYPFTYIFAVLFWGAILFFIIRRRIRKRRAEFSIIRCHICGKSDCRHIRKAKKARKIAEKAKKISVKNPDKAIALLQKSHKMQKKLRMHPNVLLDLRLEQIEILINCGRNDEAEQKLFADLEYGRKIKDRDFLIDTKKDTPEFYRNIYCLHLYRQFVRLYSSQDKYLHAALFSTLLEYAKQENHFHNKLVVLPDNVNAGKFLKKAKRQDLIPIFEKAFKKYFAPLPTQFFCCQLQSELSRYMEKI